MPGMKNIYSISWIMILSSFLVISCGGSKESRRSHDMIAGDDAANEIPVDKSDPAVTAPFTLNGWEPAAFINTNTPHKHSDSTPTLYVTDTGIGGQIFVYSDARCTDEIIKTSSKAIATPVTLPALKAGEFKFYIKGKDAKGKLSSCIDTKVSYRHVAPMPFVEISTGITKYFLGGVIGSDVFAGLRSGGAVEVFGSGGVGRDVSQVEDQLFEIQKIVAVPEGFLAYKKDGEAIFWGPRLKEEYLAIAPQLKDGFKKVVVTSGGVTAFLLHDGSVVSNIPSYITPTLAVELSSGVSDIFTVNGALFALKNADAPNNKSLLTWASFINPPPASFVSAIASGVTEVAYYSNGVAVRKGNKSVVVWGINDILNATATVQSRLAANVEQIVSNNYGFAVRTSSGSAFSWGLFYNTMSASITNALSSNVINLRTNSEAFLAQKSDGSVVPWGHTLHGGSAFNVVPAELAGGIAQIWSNKYSYLVRKTDDRLIAWGGAQLGGSLSAVEGEDLTDHEIRSCPSGYIAVAPDGESFVSWGFNHSINGASVRYQNKVKQVLCNDRYGFVLTENGDLLRLNALQPLATKVSKAYLSNTSIAALLMDGSIKHFDLDGKKPQSEADALKLTQGVKDIVGVGSSFAALRNNGELVLWPYDFLQPDLPIYSELKSDVARIDRISDYLLIYKKTGKLIVLNHYLDLDKAVEFSNVGSHKVLNLVELSNLVVILLDDGRLLVNEEGDEAEASVRSAVEAFKNAKAIFDVNPCIVILNKDAKVGHWCKSTPLEPTQTFITQLQGGFKQLVVNSGAQAAVLNNGSVVAYGNATYGGVTTEVASKLSANVTRIIPLKRGFYAVKSNKEVVGWGVEASYLEESQYKSIANLTELQISEYGIFGKKDSDSYMLLAYDSDVEGLINQVLSSNVKRLYAFESYFVVVYEDGRILSMADEDTHFSEAQQFKDYVDFYGHEDGVIGKRSNGSLVAWGDESIRSISQVSDRIGLVKKVVTNEGAFAVLLQNGTVISWGNYIEGGNVWAPNLRSK